jgi:predicted CXXCH cytochrome family protein
MTRNVTETTVAAPFAGEALTLGDDRATLETKAGVRFVRVESGGRLAGLYRVTRVIGGRHREDFAGVQVAGYDTAPSKGADELVLPVSYLIERRRLRYKGYSVMVKERPRMAVGPVWNRTCLFCHNTVPLLATLYGALGPSKNSGGYQGEVVDRLLPEERAFRYTVADEAGLRDALSREMTRLGASNAVGPLSTQLREAIGTTRNRFTGAELLEVGIGCEACHGGAREHVHDPAVHTSLLPRAPYLSVREGPAASSHAPSPADIENHACARCHQVLFTRYPWTWEGGRRSAQAGAGGSHISSGEARDLMLGGCKGELRCTPCHEPHSPDESAHLAALETPRGNPMCVSCHSALRGPEAVKAHTHHDPEGPGGACVACHMAKKNLSLDGRLSRYHRIGSPTDAVRVLEDRPLECALCHQGKSVAELVGAMEAWWGKRYDREILARQYGSLDANVLRATLERGKPHEKAVAMFVLGGVKDRAAGPLFAAELAGDIPLVRGYAADALRATYGDACDLDLAADGATLRQAMVRCSQASGLALPGVGKAAAGAEEGPTED